MSTPRTYHDPAGSPSTVPTRIASILAMLVIPLVTVLAAATPARADSKGGLSFNDATPIGGSATVEQQLVLGERVYWRVDLRPGQRLEVDMTLRLGADYVSAASIERSEIEIYGPIRNTQSCTGDETDWELGALPDVVELGCTTGTIGDGATPANEDFALPGPYYVSATMTPGESNLGVPKPLRMDFRVSGEARQVVEPSFDPGTPTRGAVVPRTWKDDTATSAGDPDGGADSEGDAGSEGSAGSDGEKSKPAQDSATPASQGSRWPQPIVALSAGAFLLACLVGGVAGYALGRTRTNGANRAGAAGSNRHPGPPGP